jgi:hypothetical protein
VVQEIQDLNIEITLLEEPMTYEHESDKLRRQYSLAIGDYEAATDALRQCDRELFNGPILDIMTVSLKGQGFKRQEENSYKRLSRAREAYSRALQ